jgi:hypothetical protein
MTINLKELFSLHGELNERAYMSLLTAINEGQSADFDYLKFKASYKSLFEMGMDESTAAKSAFVTASTMGITKDKLLTSVQQYKNIMTREREKFAEALKHQIAQNIDAKTIEIQNLEKRAEDNLRKIEALKREEEIIKQEIQKLDTLRQEATDRINTTRDGFKSTFDLLYSEIEQDHKLYDNIL